MKTSYTFIFSFAIFIATFYLASCENPKYIKGDTSRTGDIRYIQDVRTGVCFAERGGGETYAFTCVPCDSVKNLINTTVVK